jgi:hypothetical protein
MWTGVAIVVVLFVLLVVNANRKIFKIDEPELGILNLIGPEAEDFVTKDRDSIRSAFYSVKESVTSTPKCDVLLLYARINSDGSLDGTQYYLRQIIAQSNAKIVIVATENEAGHYTAALKQPGDGRANLVLTLDRRAWIFFTFLNRLFEIIATGISMPLAWVRLAPQRPGLDHEDCPSTIFLCEVGGVTFKHVRGNFRLP